MEQNKKVIRNLMRANQEKTVEMYLISIFVDWLTMNVKSTNFEKSIKPW